MNAIESKKQTYGRLKHQLDIFLKIDNTTKCISIDPDFNIDDFVFLPTGARARRYDEPTNAFMQPSSMDDVFNAFFSNHGNINTAGFSY